MPPSPSLTVCIPAYQSESWLEETLSSLEAQTLQDFRVLISVDGYDLHTYERLRPLLVNPKYKIHLQKQLLGWVGNTNWLLETVETAFACILPHDDLFHPLYLEELYRHLLKHPKCLLAYSDTQMMGPDPSFKTRYFAQPSVKGSPIKRMENYLLRHFNAAGFRGLIRQEALKLAGLIEENPFDNFAADTNWIGKIVKYGEIHRIPVALCTKRYHPHNTHTKWFAKTSQEKKRAWRAACQLLLNDFLKTTPVPSEQDKLKRAAQVRFRQGCLQFRL